MANEITMSVVIQLAKGALAFERSLAQIVATMTGNAMMHAVVSVGTMKETLGLGDIVTPGMVLLLNLDAANYIEVGTDADAPFIKLKAGEFALFRAGGATLSAKSHTAACLLEYAVLED